jgi:hypothetical protein
MPRKTQVYGIPIRCTDCGSYNSTYVLSPQLSPALGVWLIRVSTIVQTSSANGRKFHDNGAPSVAAEDSLNK